MFVNVGRSFAKYVSLNILGMITASALVFIDAIFISIAMGADGLAAVSLTGPIFGIVFGVGLLVGEGGGSKYAANMASGKEEKANAFFTSAIRTCFIISIPLIIIGVFFSEPFSMLLGARGNIVPMVAEYISVLLTASPIIILYYALESFVRNDGTPGIATVSSVVLYIFNILLDYIFIIQMNLGMFGSGLATVVAAVFSCGYLIYHWNKKARFHLVQVFAGFKKTKSLLAIGAPSFVLNVIGGINALVFNWAFLYHLGNVGVAAFGIVATLSVLVFAVFFGIAQGMQPMASHFFGAGDKEGLKKVLNYALATSFGVAVLCIASVFIFTNELVGIFNNEPNPAIAAELVSHAVVGARIYFAAFIFVGITTVSIYYLAATGAPKRALILSVLQNAGIIPIVYIAAFSGGVVAIWASYPGFEMVLAGLSVFWLVKALRKPITL